MKRLLSRLRGTAPLPKHLRRRDLRYVLEPWLLRDDNRVQLLRRGEEAFPAMLAEIAGAVHHVHLETYILRDDATGVKFQEALIERARAGVSVRLMFDSVGCFNLLSDKYLAELARAGVEIVEFMPLMPWRKRLILRLRALRATAEKHLGRLVRERPPAEPSHWYFHRRDHQKILVVDDRVAFTGGINIGDEYAPRPKAAWYDLQVRVEGPGAIGLARAFHRAWLKGGGDPFPRPPNVPNAGPELRPMLVHTAHNFRVRNRRRFHAAYRHALRQAEASICIMNAYFIPDQRLVWALQGAAKRGVAVRVMVPAHSDVELVRYASRYLYARLLRAGVRIFEHQGRMMHAKATAIDRVWATVGSYNLDKRSMTHNLEAGVVILDPDFSRSLEREFDACLRDCREVEHGVWRRRGFVERFLEWFAHLFAYWL